MKTFAFKIKPLFNLACLLSLTLYDFYDEKYGPVFIYFGYMLAFLLTLRGIGEYFNPSSVFIGLGMSIYMISGAGVTITYLAFAAGLTISIQFVRHLGRPLMHAIAVKVLCIHLVFFYIFYLIAKTTGKYISIQQILGLMEQRTNFEEMYRPCGVFFEPNSYCVFILLSLVLIKSTGRISAKIFALSIGSILLSKSLWGVAIVPIFGLMVYRQFSIKNLLLISIAAITVCLAIIQDELILSRYTNLSLGEELSFEIRIGDINQWLTRVNPIGEGFDFNNWQSPSIFGAWLLIKSGWVWTVLYLSFNLWYLKINKYMILALAALLFTYPPLTTAFYHIALVCSGRFGENLLVRDNPKKLLNYSCAD
jgi:hypothetical protein